MKLRINKLFALLCRRIEVFDFVKFSFVVKSHHVDVVFGGIFQHGGLFAGVGIDDARWGDVHAKNFLNFSL